MELDPAMRERARGCAVGAAVGDALGMPLEFGPRQPADRLVREMRPGRIPAGAFTDDTFPLSISPQQSTWPRN